MAKFVYIGATKEGVKVRETVEAQDKFEVYTIARQSGHTVSSVAVAGTFSLGDIFSMESINYFLSRVKSDELVMMTRNLSSMLKAGLPLSRAISVIERQSSNPRLKVVMQKVREDISKGDPFNVALGRFPNIFSPLYVSMVRAGEESGNMVEALRIIAVQLERSSTLRKKVKGAMIYPAIIITVMLIIGVLMMIYVVPTLTSTFVKMNVELPAATKMIIAISDLFKNQGLLVLAAFIVTVIGTIMLARTSVGRRVLHFTFIHIPVIGLLVRQTNAAYTARTLASLLSSGVDVMGALTITRDVLQNVYYKEVLQEAVTEVEKGNPLSTTFMKYKDLYPILVGEMISVGEETGQISQMLNELAIFYEGEVEQKTKDLSTIIEPILMVIIAGGVGFFALAMIAPIYSVTDSIN